MRYFRLSALVFALGLALSLALAARAAPAPGCPGRVHDARAHLSQVTDEASAGRATQIDVENAEIDLVEARYACEAIPRGMYCREKDWHLSTIERILAHEVENGTATQDDLAKARARLQAHRAECGAPSAPVDPV